MNPIVLINRLFLSINSTVYRVSTSSLPGNRSPRPLSVSECTSITEGKWREEKVTLESWSAPLIKFTFPFQMSNSYQGQLLAKVTMQWLECSKGEGEKKAIHLEIQDCCGILWWSWSPYHSCQKREGYWGSEFACESESLKRHIFTRVSSVWQGSECLSSIHLWLAESINYIWWIDYHRFVREKKRAYSLTKNRKRVVIITSALPSIIISQTPKVQVLPLLFFVRSRSQLITLSHSVFTHHTCNRIEAAWSTDESIVFRHFSNKSSPISPVEREKKTPPLTQWRCNCGYFIPIYYLQYKTMI